MMKLQFNPDLDYQQHAIASVKDLFLGQTPKQSNFTGQNKLRAITSH
jgi:restriction endonuclease